MKAIFKTVVALAIVAGLVGCEDLDGTMIIKKAFEVNTKSGVKLAPVGTFETSLDFKRDYVIATLKLDTGKKKVTIQIPQGNAIPENGEFQISASQSGQPFDIRGLNKTEDKRSELRRDWESCSYTDYETICTPQGCTTHSVTRWGQQLTEYYIQTVTRDLTMDVVEQSTVEAMAQFKGHASSSRRVIVRQNRCF